MNFIKKKMYWKKKTEEICVPSNIVVALDEMWEKIDTLRNVTPSPVILRIPDICPSHGKVVVKNKNTLHVTGKNGLQKTYIKRSYVTSLVVNPTKQNFIRNNYTKNKSLESYILCFRSTDNCDCIRTLKMGEAFTNRHVVFIAKEGLSLELRTLVKEDKKIASQKEPLTEIQLQKLEERMKSKEITNEKARIRIKEKRKREKEQKKREKRKRKKEKKEKRRKMEEREKMKERGKMDLSFILN